MESTSGQDEQAAGPAQGSRHEGAPDVPADPAQAGQPVLRRPVDPDADRVHDMGGDIGPAPMTAGRTSSGSGPGGGGADGPRARSVGSVAAPEEDSPVAASPMDLDDPYSADPGGDAAPAPVARTDEYVDIDAPATGAAGRGADGDTAARLAQKRAETTGPDGRDTGLAAEGAAETPAQPDAERMEAALRERGPLPERRSERPASDLPDVEDGPGTSLT